MANNDYITTDCKLTVSKNTAKLDEEIFLYKNDRNIKLLIEIVDNKYRYKSDDLSNLLVKYKASYAQVKWYKNAEVKKEFPIQATDDGKVVFVIEGQLIDEDTELGDYDLQLRLLNESQESIRSLPIIKGAVHILKPLFEEGDIAIVNSAIADVSMLSLDGDAIDTYNSDGTYNQTNWGNGDVISSAKLNKLEKVAKDNVDKVNKMPAKSIVEGGKIYLAKEDGTKLDSGTELPAGGTGTSYDDTEIKSDINTIKTDLGTEELTTTAKDIKGAVNEVTAQYKEIAKQIGDETLQTTAQDLKGAINEVFQNASNGKDLIAQAITGKGINATSNDSWQELATKISQILGSTVKINSLSKLSDCKFKLISSTSDTSYNSTTETGKNYNDDSWDNISIPHDWSIYNSFNSSSPSGYEGGYLDGGDAWYRFKLKTAKLEGQKVYIYFDGIYMESDVYINGTKVKDNKWYNPFYVEITDYLQYDNNDTLAVFVRNQQPSSRWYSGSGIIRNAYLVSANDVEIGINDIKITTPTLETDVKTNIANTKIDIKINSTAAKTVNLVNEIYFNNSLVKSNTKEITLSIGSNSVTDTIQINNPTLWDEYSGNLYTLKTYVKEGEVIYHSSETKYGYRYFKFDKDTGFWLNGKNLKLRGVCMHHDLGCLGAEVNKSAIERQIDLLIDMGVNAIRITHNPGSSEFLNVCAEKGILTIEEMFDCWTCAKKSNDFARYYNSHAKEVIDNTINRDKNNPSIIMWSIGNEIIRTSSSYDSATATGFVQNMINWIKAIDNERMVTMGDDTPTNSISQDCMQLLDVIGVNYGSSSEYSSVKTAIPNKSIYGSETTSALSSRGVYARDNTNKQCSSFDDDKVNWGEYASIELKKHMTDINYLAGMFVWTGFDYIGEPTPFNKYPTKSSYFGIYDTCGFPKDIMYMYQSRWTNNPMVHILPHWDWTDGNIKVWLYSNCYKVGLFLNGKSLGEKLQTGIGNKYQFEYSVTYTKGTLVANGYNQSGDIVAQDIIYTSQGTPTTVKLSTDKTNVNIGSDDLVFITCDIVDKNGVIVPTANNKITFTVEGGTIVGTDNGDATCVEKYRINIKSAFNGKVLCVVKHNGVRGNMIIKANGDNLSEKSITVVKGDKTTLTQKTKQSFIDATKPTIYDYPGTVKNYTITNNLTNCINSNVSTTIKENGNYLATITANINYKLGNVTVTMGGVDITSTSYSNGVITINSVTGNIVITANATATSSFTPVHGNGTSQISLYDGEFDGNSKEIYCEIDLATCKNVNEVIFSAGNDIVNWAGCNMHMYYDQASKELQINFTDDKGAFARSVIALNDFNLNIRLNKNGLYVNDDLVTGYAGNKVGAYASYMSNFAKLKSIQIGAKQGNNLSNATYNNLIIRNITE